MNQKGVAHIFLILFLLVGLAVAVYLVQQKTNILPKANDENPDNTFAGSALEPTPTPISFVPEDCDGPLYSVCWYNMQASTEPLPQCYSHGERSECRNVPAYIPIFGGLLNIPFPIGSEHYCCKPANSSNENDVAGPPVLVSSCVMTECDRYLGKRVCIETWRNPDGSTFTKAGAATEQTCE